jgi:hypothetical protein
MGQMLNNSWRDCVGGEIIIKHKNKTGSDLGKCGAFDPRVVNLPRFICI